MLRKETNGLEYWFEHVHRRSEVVHIYYVITHEEVHVLFLWKFFDTSEDRNENI